MNAPVLLRPKTSVPVKAAQLRFLGHAHELEESGPPRVASTVILAISGLLVAGIGWAAVTPVHRVVVAPGQVAPTGAIASVQHLEGGIVASVLVEDGESVEADQPILELQGAAALAELKALQARESALSIQQARLSAFVHGGALRGSLGEHGEASGFLAAQLSLLDAQRESKKQQRNVLERQLAAKRSDRTALEDQITLARKQASLAVQEREARRELFEKGLTTRAAYIEAQRADNRAQSDLAALDGQLQRTTEAVLEAEARLRELDARLASEAELEIGRVSAELLEVREAMAKLRDRAERLVVRAPTAGRVKDLKAAGAGSIVTPGMTVAEIVPQDQPLRVEAKISPRDVGDVRLGQPVEVKVESFAFSSYGAVPGRLEQLAASTTADADGALYYRSVIRLDRDHVGADPSARRLKAGMTVQADIVTGERSVLQHLVAPVQNALASALREH
jgi:HlyD family secretion protein/adhesin transport system membrane fusion protein